MRPRIVRILDQRFAKNSNNMRPQIAPLVMEEQTSRKSVPMWIHVDHRVFEPRNTERTLGISPREKGCLPRKIFEGDPPHPSPRNSGPRSVMVTLLTLKQEVRGSNPGAAPPKSLEPKHPHTPPPGRKDASRVPERDGVRESRVPGMTKKIHNISKHVLKHIGGHFRVRQSHWTLL